MKFGETIWNFLTRSKKSTAKSTADESSAGYSRGGYPLWLYSSSSSMSVATVYRCITLLSNKVATLPVMVKKRTGGIFIEEDRGNLPYLLNIEPDPSMNAFDFWKQVVVEVLCSGNAYIVPFYNTSTGEWERLALCGRNTVTHDTTNDTYSVSDYVNGVYGVFDESQVIHIKGMSGNDQKSGMSVLTHARLSMDTAKAGDKEALERFDSGGNVRGILSIKNTGQGGSPFLQNNEKEAYKVARSLDRQQKEMNIVALPGEYSFQQYTLSSVDMQFLESRKFTVREICRFFGVHPSFVFDDTSNNYKSAEMASVSFLSDTLDPMLRQIENELRRKLYPRSLSMKRKIEFDRQSLYACDLDSKVKYLQGMIQTGVYTINDARVKEGREPVEGGDKVLVSANLKSIDELTSGNLNNDNNGEE